jgi:TrmH family RNA methyltransferase
MNSNSFTRSSGPKRGSYENRPKKWEQKDSKPSAKFQGRPHKERAPIAPFIKRLGNLRTEKGRLSASQFLVEGIKPIIDILEISPDILHEVFVVDNKDKGVKTVDPKFLSLVKQKRVQMQFISKPEIDFLSNVENSQGVVAVANFSNLKLDWAKCRYVTLLDGVQDPGNVGAIFRTSLAMGMDAVLLGKGTCEAYNPKVVRASVGEFLRLPFEAGVDLASKIQFLRSKGFTILATSSHATHTIETVKLRKKVAIIVGNEGSGVQDILTSMADEIIQIPLNNKVESLNVSVAHGILCNELVKLRS